MFLYQILANTIHGKIFRKTQKKIIKISAPTWNDKLELPDKSYSVLGIQNCFAYIIRRPETLPDNPPIRIYVNKTKKRIIFKVKTRLSKTFNA